ncbi:unnamed protein product [Acanthoscelides obtectus]|uniref:Uncharacterized protein n=1 Tax=Acanthoscelides obtectus TaxID=200917 RepID=A0A9P0LFT0_ACAOB|nr:unnamed protein product [Acanthoscelides obtectus]CAK1673034.1 hypothetical protein AOBTE_LOCUS29213 [Acanthoscelides obtectus]
MASHQPSARGLWSTSSSDPRSQSTSGCSFGNRRDVGMQRGSVSQIYQLLG